MKSVSRETRIYLAIWRKAFREGEANLIEIKASSKALATAQRLGLYRAIRPYREGKVFDEELRKAAEGFVACLIESNGNYSVKLKPRMTLTELEKQMFDLGLGETDLLSTEEKLVNESLSGFLDEPNLAAERKNPFYSRED